MRPSRLGSSFIDVLRRLLHLLASPVKHDAGRGGLVIQPYRGYGSQDEIFLMGRVFRQLAFGAHVPEGTMLRDAIDVVRRLLRWGLRDVTLTARFEGIEQEVTTDRDGYFRLHMMLPEAPPPDRIWHSVDLQLPGQDRTVGEVYILPETARRVIISDIDDTVMHTGVANTLMMLYRLFVQDAEHRTAFPGVGVFYEALHDGASGNEHNPMLYVSRGPWSIYEVLDAFFNLQEIPVGPVLFLREWGLTFQRPLPRSAEDHKLSLIRDMLALYDDLPFVLVGDSGQHDPEIYAQVVHDHPGRVEAIYIRNVSREEARQREIDRLAEEVAEAESSLLLAADSFAMAEHAAEHGLIAEAALDDVLRAREELDEEPVLRPTRTVESPTPQATEAAVQRGELEAALDERTGDDAPPSVTVEPESDDEDDPGRRVE